MLLVVTAADVSLNNYRIIQRKACYGQPGVLPPTSYNCTGRHRLGSLRRLVATPPPLTLPRQHRRPVIVIGWRSTLLFILLRQALQPGADVHDGLHLHAHSHTYVRLSSVIIELASNEQRNNGCNLMCYCTGSRWPSQEYV